MKPGIKQLTRVAWLMAAVLVTVATDTRAQNPLTTPVMGSFTVNPTIIFTLNSAPEVAFPNADPDVVNSITAAPLMFQLQVRTPAPMQVLIKADRELMSGSDKIPLSKMTFECNIVGHPLTPATSISLTPQTLTQVDSGDYTGSITFRLANEWTYASGIYTTTVTITMATP